MVDAFEDYYRSIYNLKEHASIPQTSKIDIQTFLIELPTLSESQLISIYYSLWSKNIDSLPNGKSPGPDGFTNGYYNHFKLLLVPHLVTLFHTAASTAAFPSDMLRAHIVTLPKLGKDPTTPANLNPISILDSNVKIYTKLLARCLIDIIPTLVKPH